MMFVGRYGFALRFAHRISCLDFLVSVLITCLLVGMSILEAGNGQTKKRKKGIVNRSSWERNPSP